jgi:hypothetical protein
MEPALEQRTPTDDDLLSAAAYYARDVQALCMDVSAMAFPSGHHAPTEEMLSAAATKMRDLISGIERAILTQDAEREERFPFCWDILVKSGFLREPALIDFVLAQFADERLNIKILKDGETRLVDQLPARLLSDSNPMVAEAAQTILASETLLRRAPALIYRELSTELLYQTTWRVVAALQILSGNKNEHHIENAKLFLANHDEANAASVAARKIVHFMPAKFSPDLFEPGKSGATIFAAALSARTGLDHNHVLRLLDGHSSAPIAILLRRCELTREDATGIICLLKGFNLTPLEINSIERHYDLVTIEDTKAAIGDWVTGRVRQLAFSDMENSTP